MVSRPAATSSVLTALVRRLVAPRPTLKIQTYWNGRPCAARPVWVLVDGECMAALEITHANGTDGDSFYIDNTDNTAWVKVTLARGDAAWGHQMLNVQQVLGEMSPKPIRIVNSR